MAICEKYQIPHSHYLGGPLEWTDLDRAKAEAWDAYQRQFCPECGTRASDWDEKQGGHRHAFIGHIYRCVGCEVKEQERENNVPEDAKGIKVSLVPNLAIFDEEDDA